MIGIIDVGGGMRGIYTSGIYDYLMDKGIEFEYCMGVSSGSANMITYVAGQRGRTKKFYLDYAFEKEYMGVGSYLRNGMLINLDHIYSEITNSTGKDPLDYEAIMKSKSEFIAVTTNAITGKPRYLTKADMKKDDYTLLKASCAMPVACRKPIKMDGKLYFDGGLSDPMPYKKAFAEGCDKVVLCITKPIDFRKTKMPNYAKLLVHKYPVIGELIMTMHEKYNNCVDEAIELERQGKMLVVYPEECFDINTLTREKEGMQKLYELGYSDGRKIEEFLEKAKAEV